MRKLALIFIILFLVFCPFSVAEKIYPQLALGGGYEVTLLVTNQSSSPWSGAGLILQGWAQDWTGDISVNGIPVTESQFDIELDGDESRKFLITGDSTVRVGYLILEALSGGRCVTDDIAVSFFYSFYNGSSLVESVGVPEGIPSKSLLLPVEQIGTTTRTGFAWTSPVITDPFNVELSLIGPDGIVLDTSTVEFEGHSAKFADEIFTIPENSFIGAVGFNSENPIAVTALRFEIIPSGFQMTTVPPTAALQINYLYTEKSLLPTYSEADNLVFHGHYSLEYSEDHEQAKWVAYQLTADECAGAVERTDNFRSDPFVLTGSASLSDYSGSGYDRGHLAPAADMAFSKSAMSESFYLSNMSPQAASFNRGIWSTLEAQVRTWAINKGAIFVVTGPVLNNPSFPTIGSNQVSIPEKYFKALLFYGQGSIETIGFILSNEGSSEDLSTFIQTIDEIENETGLNLFAGLPDVVEEAVEAQTGDPTWWDTEETNPGGEGGETVTPVLYWINTNSMTRHNPTCQYYGNTAQGYYTYEKIGTACGICGG